MNKDEALDVLRTRLVDFRSEPYKSLVARIGGESINETVQSGATTYQLEIMFYWDYHRGGNVRVIGAVDGGGISAYFPLSDSFIKGPDEGFIGE